MSTPARYLKRRRAGGSREGRWPGAIEGASGRAKRGLENPVREQDQWIEQVLGPIFLFRPFAAWMKLHFN